MRERGSFVMEFINLTIPFQLRKSQLQDINKNFHNFRKISAHEFERGGLLKPIVNTIDGTPTFLSINTQNECSANTASNQVGGYHSCSALSRPQRLSRNELKQLDEKELIFELVRYYLSDLLLWF